MWVAYAPMLEAGFDATYQGLGPWLRGEITSRRFLNQINGLPPDGWFWTQVRHDEEQVRAEAEAEKASAARTKKLGGLYRKVPDELKPEYMREAV